MNNALFVFEYPENEPIRSYVPGSRDRKEVVAELNRMSSEVAEMQSWPIRIWQESILPDPTQRSTDYGE